MKHDDEFDLDLDLERRLRRIAEEPQPPVPASVYRASKAVTEQGGTPMRANGTIHRLPRRTFAGLVSVAGIAAALVVAVALAGILISTRNSNVGNSPAPTPGPTQAAIVPTDSGLATPLPTSGATASPAETPSASPTPAVETPTPTPAPSETPAPATAWKSVKVSKLAAGPLGATAVASWDGGYIAVARRYGTTAIVYSSADGRTWSKVTDPAFANANEVDVARCGGGLVAAALDGQGQTTFLTSPDGTAWASSGSAMSGGVAGTSQGAVRKGYRNNAWFVESSTDCHTWKPVALSPASKSPIAVEAGLGGTFVVWEFNEVPTKSDVLQSWVSANGQTWQACAPAQGLNPTCVGGMVGSRGAIRILGAGAGGSTQLQATTDGTTWTDNTTDPFGYLAQGEGVGSPNGAFSADGSRILAYDLSANGHLVIGSKSLYVSANGTNWTPLAVAGATDLGPDNGLQAFPLRDGILFATPSGAWFGQAAS